MRMFAVMVAIVLSLGLQPPVVSNIGVQPTPPVVGMTGGMGVDDVAVPGTVDLWKFAITQGGLTVLALAMFWWITRELSRQKAEKAEDKQILIVLVEKNTTALVNSAATNERLARAVEANKLA